MAVPTIFRLASAHNTPALACGGRKAWSGCGGREQGLDGPGDGQEGSKGAGAPSGWGCVMGLGRGWSDRLMCRRGGGVVIYEYLHISRTTSVIATDLVRASRHR